MAYNPDVPSFDNYGVEDLNKMRENFQILANIATSREDILSLAVEAGDILDSRIVEHNLNILSPSNGYYVRWNNGLQVCWHSMNIRSQSDWGASYTSGEWTLPAEFDDDGYARFATAGQSEAGTDSTTGRLNAGMSRRISSTPSSCRWSVRSNGADHTTTASVFLLAIGRWK